MDIRELRYFVQIARSGSVSAAAHHLNVAQPALSRQLRKLEDELGVTLLDRHGKGVALTEAGSRFLPQAEALIDQFRQVMASVRSDPVGFAGSLALGTAPTSGLLILPEVYRRFRAMWPEATLVVREGISTFLEEWLLEHRIDVSLLHNPTPIEGITLTPLLRERMVLAVRPEDLDRYGPGAIAFRDLRAVPLVLASLPHSNRRLIERVALSHSIPLNVVMEVNSIPLIKAMVHEGVGATIQTYAGVSRDVARGELAVIEIEAPQVLSYISTGIRRDGSDPAMVRTLEGVLRASVAELVSRGDWPGATLVEPG